MPVLTGLIFCTDEDSDEDGEDGEDEYDVFSNLEESRMQLEQDLGCEKFLQAYKAVQVSTHQLLLYLENSQYLPRPKHSAGVP